MKGTPSQEEHSVLQDACCNRLGIVSVLSQAQPIQEGDPAFQPDCGIIKIVNTSEQRIADPKRHEPCRTDRHSVSVGNQIQSIGIKIQGIDHASPQSAESV
jgi:hypothetical protein